MHVTPRSVLVTIEALAVRRWTDDRARHRSLPLVPRRPTRRGRVSGRVVDERLRARRADVVRRLPAAPMRVC